MRDWERIEARLARLFEDVSRTVTGAYPALQEDRRFEVMDGGSRLRASAAFTYDANQQWYEDLLLLFEVNSGEDAGGHPGDTARYEVTRGPKSFVGLPPITLPGGQNGQEYEQAILSYVDQAAELTRMRLDAILPVLATPYFPAEEGR